MRCIDDDGVVLREIMTIESSAGCGLAGTTDVEACKNEGGTAGGGRGGMSFPWVQNKYDTLSIRRDDKMCVTVTE